MMKAYRITDWEERFELPPNPKRLDERLCEASKLLSRGKAGEAALAVWLVLVKFAAKMPQRGLLVSIKKPLTVKCLAEETGISERLLALGIRILMSPELNWIELVDCPKYLILGDHAACGHIASAPELTPVVDADDEAPLISLDTIKPELEQPISNKKEKERTVEWEKAVPKYKTSLNKVHESSHRWSAFVDHPLYITEKDAAKRVRTLPKKSDSTDFLDENQKPGLN